MTTTFGFGSSFQVIADGPSFSTYLVERETKVLRRMFRRARSGPGGCTLGLQHCSEVFGRDSKYPLSPLKLTWLQEEMFYSNTVSGLSWERKDQNMRGWLHAYLTFSWEITFLSILNPRKGLLLGIGFGLKISQQCSPAIFSGRLVLL